MRVLIGMMLAARLSSVEVDIPLAVTDIAHPSLRKTPTAAELKLSQDYLKRGLKFLSKNLPQRAIDEFNDSVRLAPDAANYKALGTAYYQVGNTQKAVWAYKESLQLKSDSKLQALVYSLEGVSSRDDVDRHRALLSSARAAEKAGRLDSALRDYAQAHAIKPDAEAALPALRLAARLAEDYVEHRALAKAVETLLLVQPVRARSRDLSKQDLAVMAQLDRAESRVVQLTGEKLREHEVAMQTDKERWKRKIAEKEAGKVTKLKIEPTE